MSAPVAVTICGPNLRDQSKGQLHVHALGCADVNQYGPNGRMGGESPWQATVRSRRCLVESVYEGQLAEGCDYKSAAADFWFAPCLQGVLR